MVQLPGEQGGGQSTGEIVGRARRARQWWTGFGGGHASGHGEDWLESRVLGEERKKRGGGEAEAPG